MISTLLLLTSLFCLLQQHPHPSHALVLNPSTLSNGTTTTTTTHPLPAAAAAPIPTLPEATFYDIPNTELSLYISDIWRRIDTPTGHDLLRLAIQEAQSAVTRGRGDLPLKPRCWAVERPGLQLQIVGGGPRTELTNRQMSYEILLEVVKGLETFFSEVEGGYYLTFFFVLAKGSRQFPDGYGFGRLRGLGAEGGESGGSGRSGCFVDGEGLSLVQDSVQVDRFK